MPRLFFTERGRIQLSCNEEITRWRWVRKTLTLPVAAAHAAAELWMPLQMYSGNRAPLIIEVNGKRVGSIKASSMKPGEWWWARVPIAARRLRTGVNQIVLRCDNPAMNAWTLGIENGHAQPKSAISFDKGHTWRSDAMGANGSLRGEYVIRLRSFAPSLKEPKPPRIIYETPSHPRVRELRDFIPTRVRRISDRWIQTLALRTFVASLWKYNNRGGIYAPWDPLTIVDWARRNRGHTQDNPIAMCVHYAVVMTALAIALGHRARCIVSTGNINSGDGHFVCEVWNKNMNQWVMHDPNFDTHYEDAGPLSAVDLAQRVHRRERIEPLVRSGPGMPRDAKLRRVFDKFFATGISFQSVGIWSKNNYISDPASAPPAHGSVSYAETDIVWFNPVGMFKTDPMAMFPYRSTTRTYFDRNSNIVSVIKNNI